MPGEEAMPGRPRLLELASERVVVLDGAMGTMIQAAAPAPEDFRGLDGCNEILVETRPDLILDIHAAYLQAGCDAVETDTFGANGVVLGEYGVAARTEELNRIAASLARRAALDFSSPDRPRFVLGSIGPGTRLPSLGHISFQDLVGAFEPQVRGLLAGGADAHCI
ncbi:MAG: homocysteine S-methyltransferase family protein, partial [Deltaproteobacteria bacterium]|nr:homocysteine S-methyltransferase family protein [Deltaproteobacteria bacterium]